MWSKRQKLAPVPARSNFCRSIEDSNIGNIGILRASGIAGPSIKFREPLEPVPSNKAYHCSTSDLVPRSRTRIMIALGWHLPNRRLGLCYAAWREAGQGRPAGLMSAERRGDIIACKEGEGLGGLHSLRRGNPCCQRFANAHAGKLDPSTRCPRERNRDCHSKYRQNHPEHVRIHFRVRPEPHNEVTRYP